MDFDEMKDKAKQAIDDNPDQVEKAKDFAEEHKDEAMDKIKDITKKDS